LLKDHLEAAAVAVAIALTLRLLVIAAYKIPTGSMIPTLKVGDFIFSLKLPYSLPFLNPRVPQRGEVIVFISPEDSKTSLIKRVVGAVV
jgi:signal peptidase I